MVSGIYQIENRANGKRYVGSSVNLKRRWGIHLNTLRHGKHRNRHLQRAFDKYGEGVFMFSVLEYVQESGELIKGEQHYFDTLKPEYNISPTAGSSLGVRYTLETRRKMSQAHTGVRHAMYGKHHTVEARAKISEANMGRRVSPEARAKMSRARMGHPVSIETRAKISEAHKGKSLSVEHREKLSAAHRGKSPSTETRAKLSEALKAYWHRKRSEG